MRPLESLHRENSQAHKGEAKKSLSRATALIGMAPDLDPASYDHSEMERYGVGKGEYGVRMIAEIVPCICYFL